MEDAKHDNLIINPRVTSNESRKIKENELLRNTKMNLSNMSRCTDIKNLKRYGELKDQPNAGCRNYKQKQGSKLN